MKQAGDFLKKDFLFWWDGMFIIKCWAAHLFVWLMLITIGHFSVHVGQFMNSSQARLHWRQKYHLKRTHQLYNTNMLKVLKYMRLETSIFIHFGNLILNTFWGKPLRYV